MAADRYFVSRDQPDELFADHVMFINSPEEEEQYGPIGRRLEPKERVPGRMYIIGVLRSSRFPCDIQGEISVVLAQNVVGFADSPLAPDVRPN